MKLSQRVSELETQTVGSTLGRVGGSRNLQSGIIAVKTVNGDMVLNLCTPSDDALYLYHVSRKYLKGLQSYLEDAV